VSSYQEMSDRYRDPAQRGRFEACIREQAHLTYADAGGAEQALANDVIGGDMPAIDALIAAVTVGPNSAVLDNDADLTSAVQGAWPVTAAALHPQT
jgi:hypothetical protein